MATNKLKVMLSFMREINDGNVPDATDYGLEDWEYWDIIEACQDEGLIKDAVFAKADGFDYPLKAVLSGTKLTVKGMEYLDAHSPAMKAYKGIKELRDWLPF